MVDAMNVCLEIQFPESTSANIAYNSLRVDKEPSRSSVSKILSVNGDKLQVKFSGLNAKSLRTAVNSFMEHTILVTETIKRFGPATAEQYNYFSP